jgi:hypothetical protein
LHATEKETEFFQSLRLEFWQTLQGILAENLIFIDESGVNLSLVRLFARASKGKRAHAPCPQKKRKNVSLIGAISLKGVITQSASHRCNRWTDIGLTH